MTKKGLSDIVTNVLIILLVLVAVGIIWLFLRPTVSSVGNVQGSTDCLTIDVQPVSCTGGNTVTIKRNAGVGALRGIVVVSTDPTTQAATPTTLAETTSQVTALKTELATTTYTYSATQAGKRITVAAIVAGAEGTKTCPASTTYVTC